MRVETTAIAPDILRVGVFPDGRPPDYRSEAVILEPAGGEVDAHRLDPFTFEVLDDGEDPVGPKLRVSAPSCPASASSAAGSGPRGSRRRGRPRCSGTSTRPPATPPRSTTSTR